MKKKLLLLICIVMIASVVMTACSMSNDDTQLRKDGYNIVVTFDCGKYANETVSAYEDAKTIQYGDVSVDERSNFIMGQISIENAPVRKFYFQENACVFEPGAIGQVGEPLMAGRVFAGWYLASVVEYKLDENGNPLKDKWGQFVYNQVVPQADDVKWDFTNSVGDYSTHPYAVTKYVYDATQPFDAQVTVGGQTVTNGTQYTDEQLGYNAENGYNIYLYARWTVQQRFFIESDVNGDGTWESVYSAEPDPSSNKLTGHEAKLKQDGYTFYKLYSDKNFQNEWNKDATFNSAYTGSTDSLRPYLVLYAKYIQGDWSIVNTASQLVSALRGNKNVYLDSDVEFADNLKWNCVTNYTAEFKGNNHVVTFNNVMDNPADRTVNNIGLFGTFAGKMSDVEFVNVTINVKNYPAQDVIRCGVLAGNVAKEAVFTNVKISGKVVYSDTIRDYANKENASGKIILTIYRGGETNIDADSWFGMNSNNVTGVTYTNTVNAENSDNLDSAE